MYHSVSDTRPASNKHQHTMTYSIWCDAFMYFPRTLAVFFGTQECQSCPFALQNGLLSMPTIITTSSSGCKHSSYGTFRATDSTNSCNAFTQIKCRKILIVPGVHFIHDNNAKPVNQLAGQAAKQFFRFAMCSRLLCECRKIRIYACAMDACRTR